MLAAIAVAVFAMPADEIELFNGKDLAGWKAVFQPESTIPENVKKRLKLPAKVEDVWKVEDGELVCTGQPYGYLVTEKEFENFELSLEWKWRAGGRRPGNSGVLLYVHGPDHAYPPGDAAVWPGSIEAQLAAGNAGEIWIIPPGKLEVPERQRDEKSKRRYHHMTKVAVEKAAGDWNRYDIVSKNGSLTLKVNGTLVNEGKNANPKKGRIALQSEGTEIHFRNIKIKTLE